MPALPHGLEILTAQHRLNFCTRHSPFNRMHGDQTEPFESGTSAYCGCREVSFRNSLLFRAGIASASVPCLRSLYRTTVSVQKRCAAVQNAAICLRLRYWQSTDNLLTLRKPKAVSTARSFFFALV
jgi:hypothetical protein